MDSGNSMQRLPPESGCSLAPIQPDCVGALSMCVLVRSEPDPLGNWFVLLREIPGASVYLGAITDASGRIVDWLEIWVQTLDFRNTELINYRGQLTNTSFDQRWRKEFEDRVSRCPDVVFTTGLETSNPSPLLIQPRRINSAGFASVTSSAWRLCKDDGVLESCNLPAYTKSPHRYLFDGGAGHPNFLALTEEAPSNSHVQPKDRMKDGAPEAVVFNPCAGLIQASRFHALELEDYFQVLEGKPWDAGRANSWATRLLGVKAYIRLEEWSSRARGLPFLRFGGGDHADRLNEIFYLKLAAIVDMMREVQDCIRVHQLPLLNISPASFCVSLPEANELFPALWAAKCKLLKPSQAFPLHITSTQQRYFIRMGSAEPSPYLPEGLAAQSSGVGSVFIRGLAAETDGVVLDGRLVAEDYVALDPHDLLWFRLPLAQERLELYAHVYTSESTSSRSREVRFRTIPTKISDSTLAVLKRAMGTAFPRSPYEVWPLLSSPCDLFSVGVIAVRALLSNSTTNLPVILDEVLSLARLLGSEPFKGDAAQRLLALTKQQPRLLDLISPHFLAGSGETPAQARDKISFELWLEAIATILRIFPGCGSHSYCSTFGHVSPLALETVFNEPIDSLELVGTRLRSILAPSLSDNDEIASIVREQLLHLDS